MKRKGALIVAILLLSIGFAAISTTLIINGSTNIGENTDDYSVIFTKATLDGVDVYSSVVDDTKKIINFTTSDLKKLNDTSMLTYEVTNNSSNYDAEVKINCGLKNGVESKYTSIKNELENNVSIVKAKESVNGTLTVTLNQTSTEEITEEYTCTLEFNAVERTELSVSYDGPTEWTFDYTGGEQTFVAPVTGTYKLETWGAQGYTVNSYTGGYGGYSIGKVNFSKNQKIYLFVGEKGKGGIGNGTRYSSYPNSLNATAVDNASYIGSGGGSTHIVNKNLLIKDITDLSDLIMVAGGGGASTWTSSNEWAGTGGAGGGYVGNSGKSTLSSFKPGGGGTQATGGVLGNVGTAGQFGLSLVKTTYETGGGGGFYGGGTSWGSAGGGGSGYIGNSLLTEKSMYCYNCQESTEESTKTISTTCVSEVPTENCAKSGNGYARITLISY